MRTEKGRREVEDGDVVVERGIMIATVGKKPVLALVSTGALESSGFILSSQFSYATIILTKLNNERLQPPKIVR